MASKVDIANLALNHLGMNNITNFTEGSPSSNAVNSFFIPCRDDVFREYRWPFATVREALTLTNDVVLGYDYVYLYPVRAATIWSVFDESTIDTKEDQEFEVIYVPDSNRRVVCTGFQSAYAEYTYKLEDTTLFDPKFVLALSYKLAGAMAHQLIGSPEVGLKMGELYSGIISQAKTIGYTERLKKPTQISSYQNARG